MCEGMMRSERWEGRKGRRNGRTRGRIGRWRERRESGRYEGSREDWGEGIGVLVV